MNVMKWKGLNEKCCASLKREKGSVDFMYDFLYLRLKLY